MARRKERSYHTKNRFPERAAKKGWEGPTVDYKEIDVLRKFLTGSNKIMSRKRAGTCAEEQRAIKLALKRARFIGLLPYKGF